MTLTWFEVFQAAQVGVMRQIEALKLGRPDRYGYDGDGWSLHINGAAAEMRVAKTTGSYWNSLVRSPRELSGDVADMQVRWGRRQSSRLIVHPEDPDDALFVLVVGEAPNLEIVGTIFGGQAKKPEWWEDPTGNNRPAFFVPQSALAPLMQEAA